MLFPLLALALTACGGALTFKIKGTPKLPDADGKVVATVAADQGLTVIDVQLDHLAPPDRIGGASTHYVVWSRRSADGQYARLGALKYDKNKRTGSLHASAPDTDFVLTITAEPAVTPAAPSVNVVFEQKVAR
jgi:hypothetical protein